MQIFIFAYKRAHVFYACLHSLIYLILVRTAKRMVRDFAQKRKRETIFQKISPYPNVDQGKQIFIEYIKLTYTKPRNV